MVNMGEPEQDMERAFDEFIAVGDEITPED